MAYDNTNTGALFKAKERATDKHPEYSGTINIEGREYWLAGWIKESPKVGKFFSLAVKPKDAKPDKPQTATQRLEAMKDDIPF